MTPQYRHYFKHRDAINAQRRLYRIEHPNEAREKDRVYRISHQASVNASLRKYRASHRQALNDRANLRWRNRTEDQIARGKLCSQIYYAGHKDKVLQAHRAWVGANRGRWNRYMSEYERIRRQKDIGFRLLKALRRHVRMAITRSSRYSSVIELLGCGISQARKHLEFLWTPGMSWDNYGNAEGCWSIDHIRPCACFDLTDPRQQKICFHISNLQPLWHIDNMRKQDKQP